MDRALLDRYEELIRSYWVDRNKGREPVTYLEGRETLIEEIGADAYAALGNARDQAFMADAERQELELREEH